MKPSPITEAIVKKAEEMNAQDHLAMILDHLTALSFRDTTDLSELEQIKKSWQEDESFIAVSNALLELSAIKRELAPENIGNFSDGYHTFNELYHHRAVLFSVIVNQNPQIAWKSKQHHDGTMYENMFIVGIDTPNGQATYHYDINPYWDYFKVKELEKAPLWDGHTPQQAINRLYDLGQKESELSAIKQRGEEQKAILQHCMFVEFQGATTIGLIDYILKGESK